MNLERRQFIKELAVFGGAALLLPSMVACSTEAQARSKEAASPQAVDPLALPMLKPADWDAVAFNTQRALAGAAPASYHGAIKGADGATKHVGKHLPYVVNLDNTPAGYVAVMFGDEKKGYARHPNSAAVPELDDEGHWYDWISIRKASDVAQTIQSNYGNWPQVNATDNGQLRALIGDDLTVNKGIESVYLAALPKDVKSGDMIRITGHCKKHGEWTEFFTLA